MEIGGGKIAFSTINPCFNHRKHYPADGADHFLSSPLLTHGCVLGVTCNQIKMPSFILSLAIMLADYQERPVTYSDF